MKYVVWFRDVDKDDVALVGGKGANLGELTKAGLPVPPGFIVTAEAYFDFLEGADLDFKIGKLLKGLDVNNTKKLHATAVEIQKTIMAKPMPQKIAKEISSAYQQLYTKGSSNFYVAVRSSATAEDLPSISEDEHVLVKIRQQTFYDRIKNIYQKIVQQGIFSYEIEIPSMSKNRLFWKKISDIYQHPAKGDVLYKIKTTSGREITLSSNHSLIILNEKTLSPKVVSVKELKGDEKVPCLRRLPNFENNPSHLDILDYLQGDDLVEEHGEIKIKNNSNNWKIQYPLPRKIALTADFLYFLGVYVAEGSTYQNNNVIITNGSPQIQRRIKTFLKSLGLYQGQKINKNSLRVYCKTLVKLLHSLTGKPLEKVGKGRSCRIKKVPDFIFGLKKELIGEFLKGCFDGDGGVVNGGIEFTSTSELLVGGVIKLIEILGFKFYLRRKKYALNVIIPVSEWKSFKEFIGFEDSKKTQKLNKLIEKFKSQSNHPEFLENIEISPEITQAIRQELLERMPLEPKDEYFCPVCQRKTQKSGCYNNLKRFYCSFCHKTFYESNIKKKKNQTYINYDFRGRFLKNATPWNKGLISGHLSRNQFQKIHKKYNLKKIPDIFAGEILWDKIKEIVPIKYKGFVYDFCVPGTENFAAGIGGIITHNSASFAGQQKTFLNISGTENVLKAVRMAWASLFEARAIYYREVHHFEHLKVGLAVPIQKMVQSEKSGIMFTVDPVTNDKEKIVIEAGWGLGEAIVSGSVTPDRYVVQKNSPAGELKILEKEINEQDWKIVKVGEANKHVTVPKKEQKTQKLSDEEIKLLAEFGVKIDDHYQFPQDAEWAIEGRNIYLVQSRPVTTLAKPGKSQSAKSKSQNEIPVTSSEMQDTSKLEVLVKGIAASIGIASGPVRIIHSPSEIDKVAQGEVLVTEKTNPDFVPAMKKASAIVTDTGGQTSHAAIVSRELGIPCVVGTGTATHVLKNDQIVSVDGAKGLVYKGKVTRVEAPPGRTDGGGFNEEIPITATKVYVNLGEPSEAEKVAKLPSDGVGLMRAEFMVAEIGEHPRALVKAGKGEVYVNKLVAGLSKTCAAFSPRPVVYRATDFKTNEYRGLKGGEKYEPEESNPMIGYRGAFRYLKEPDLFALELEAIKKVRQTMENLWLMIPFVRTLEEFRQAKVLIAESGLERGPDFKLWMMVEIPSNVILIDKFLALGIDGVSIGSNDLTQLTLGIDRDNEHLAEEFDERDESVQVSISHVIRHCRRRHVSCSICGQAATTYPEIAELMVREGATSVSVSPDSVVKTRKLVASVEKKILLAKVIEEG